jgi:Flp pilus assembly protein TadG
LLENNYRQMMKRDREDPEKGGDYVSKALEPTDPTKLWNQRNWRNHRKRRDQAHTNWDTKWDKDNDRYIFSQLVSNVPFWNGWAFNVVVQKANVVRRKRKFCRVVRVLLMLTWWIEFTLEIIGLHENSHV